MRWRTCASATGLPTGDFDRINRQQNFLRAVMANLLSKGTLLKPIRLTNAVRTGQSAVVDDRRIVRSLFAAVESDDLESYVANWQDSVLPAPTQVP